MSNRFGYWQVMVRYEFDRLGYGLYIYRKNFDGTIDYKTPGGDVQVKVHGKPTTKPLFMCIFEDTEQLTQLIEQAERQGVRAPSTHTALGKLQATEKHLEDMRDLVFKYFAHPQPPKTLLEEDKSND